MTSDINQNNLPTPNAHLPPPPSPDVGGAAGSNALDPFLPGGKFYDPHACAFFAAVQTLIQGLGAMNNYLAVYSKGVLNNDLDEDNALANKLGQLSLEPGTGTAITEHNNNVTAMQQYYQAKAKAAQNMETSDISTATGLTSSEQQLSTQISQMLQQVSSISQSALQIAQA